MADEVVHIVLVGNTKETIVESIRQFPVSKAILVIGDNPDLSGAKNLADVAAEIKKDLGTLPFEELYVSLEDIMLTAQKIVGKIIDERNAGRLVRINLSGTLRTVNAAGYIAAQLTETPLYVGIPQYSGDTITGLKKVIELPLIPVKELFDEKKRIVSFLRDSNVLSLEELIMKLKPYLPKNEYDKSTN